MKVLSIFISVSKSRLADLGRVKEQFFEPFVTLDLEGMVSILEFPALLISAETLEVLGYLSGSRQFFILIMFALSSLVCQQRVV